MGAVHLPIDVPCVDKEHGFGARRLCLALVEEPQGAGQRDGVEHVGADSDDHVHGAALDQLLPDLLLGGASVGG